MCGEVSQDFSVVISTGDHGDPHDKCQEGKRDKSLLRGVGDGSNDCTRTSIKKT